MYGLIGEKLGHSFSKEIHEQLATYTYDLIPLAKDEFSWFMKNRQFQAINVTIPYKKAVLPYLDAMDEKAQRIGAVNTIVNQNGLLKGFNTDYDGFMYLLKQHHIQVQNKKVMILGNGGAAQAVKAVLRDEKIKEMVLVKQHRDEETITYEEAYQLHKDIALIVNTSPVGMYPNNESPIDLTRFHDCEWVMDVIYNPLHTSLIMQAKQLGIKAVGGLEMLIAQAKAAVELFTNQIISDATIGDIYQKLLCQQCNLVLIGMPGCGKSTIGKLLEKEFHKTFVDLDEEIEKVANKSIKDIFKEDGEPYFRELEEKITARFALEHNQILATGGGCILRNNNIVHLKQNGYLLFLDRPKEQLATQDVKRPLSSSKEAVYQLYDERFNSYLQAADDVVNNDTDIVHAIEDIKQHMKDIIQTT